MLVALLSDFGLRDAYVGVMKAIIHARAPGVPIVDLSHEVPPGAIEVGALLLEEALPYLPIPSVVVGVVDPGVGSDRAPLAARTDGRYFVGPDNGLLSWALGDEAEARRIDPHLYLTPRSDTFHGRDVFAPAAAALARGVPFAEIGTEIPSWERLPLPRPRRLADGALAARVIRVDRFGNLILDARAIDLPRAPRFLVAGRTIAGVHRAYFEGSDLIALIGSSGRVEIALPNGSAADALGVGRGATVRVEAG